MSPYDAAHALLAQLQRAFSADAACDLRKCGALLAKLKLALLSLDIHASPNPRHLLLARDTFELGARHALRTHDIPAFERYVAQLQPLYTDYAGLLGAESRHRGCITGLYLLHLLTTSRVADFHLYIAALPRHILLTPHLVFVVDLERRLMEGSYHRVLVTRTAVEVPDPLYAVFCDMLKGSAGGGVREDIAAGVERAYDSLAWDDAMVILGLASLHSGADVLLQMCASRGWKLAAGERVIDFTQAKERRLQTAFNSGVMQDGSMQDVTEAGAVMAHMLDYARALETIV